MGLFDLFRSTKRIRTGRAASPSDKASEDVGLRLIDEGNTLEAENRIDEAMRRYDAAIRLAPNLARAYLNRGNIFLTKGDTKAALDAYGTALLKDPNYASAHYNQGNAYLQSACLDQACVAYGKAIELKPDFTDAYVALGAAHEDLGDLKSAIESYRRALEIAPDYVEVWCNLGNALRLSAQLDDAVVSYRRALDIDPGYHAALSGLTRLLQALGKVDELVASVRSVLVQRPDNAEAHNNLGVALRAAGQLEEALESHRKALELQPGYADAHHRSGLCLQDLGRFEDAIARYRRALEIDPGLADTCCDLGNALMRLERPDEAAVMFERVVEISPELAEAHFNLGTSRMQLGQLDEAIACFQRALAIKPDFAGAYNNLGACLNDLGRFVAARDSYLRVVELDPNMSVAHSNLGIALQNLGCIEDAVNSFRKALEIRPDLGEAEVNLAIAYLSLGQLDKALSSARRAMDLMPDSIKAHSVLLFLLNYLSDRPASQLVDESKRFGELVASKASGKPFSWGNDPDPDRCLRVGLVSGDLRGHPVGFFIEGVLAALAANASGRLSLYAYANSFHCDAITQRIKVCCDDWCPIIGLSDEIVCEKIREDGIDILIDLSGHTLYNRLPLFAWKPAPVQVTWLGYFATTGVAEIDYLIADPWTLPESEDVNFTEEVFRLPETRLCFTPPDEDVDVAPLPALHKGYITFGCFNTITKMNDEVVALWAQILRALPESRLFLMSNQLNDSVVKRLIIERFLAHGVDGGQLMLKGSVPRAEYLAAYGQVDIALDPFPYCGGTTTVEALWMGVPVLTLSGQHFLSRQGVGLLMNAGLREWVATHREDYVARAVLHASDFQRLASIRRGLRKQVHASPIFDAPRFADHFEAALRSMWRDWCKKGHEQPR